MSLRPRPEVENLQACYHGGLDYNELRAAGLTPEQVIDFSVCANPFPPPPGLRGIFRTVAINRYPDSEATELRQCLSAKLGVAADNILVGSGAVELIRLIVLAYFGRGDAVLILEPPFGEYDVAGQIIGADIFKQWTRAGDSFVPRIDEMVSLIKQHRPKGVFICNPNNPTGQYLSRQEVELILDACGEALLILDEAYIAFVDPSWASIELVRRGNVVILRSMTKDYALAGLRLGYAVASREIIDGLRRVRPPWNVNVVAQQAGVIALGDGDYLERCKRKICRAKQFLTTELCRLGFILVPSETNFFLVRVANAKEFRTTLLKRGILVRDCTSFGLPEYIRIAPRTLAECRKLIAVLRALKRDGELEANI